MTTKGTDNRFRSLTVVGEPGTPSTPASGDFKLYVADDGTFFLMDDTGATVDLTAGGFSDPMTTRGDIIVRNASNVTARLAKGSADTFLHSDGTDVGYAAVTDAMLSTSDITTNNASTSKHGFLKKLDNNAAHFMDGTGAWSTPATSGLTTATTKDSSGNHNITSTTFVAVDTTNERVTLTTGSSGAVFLSFSSTARCNSSAVANFSFKVDGGTAEGGTNGLYTSNNTAIFVLTYTWVVTGLSSGSHTFDVCAKVDTGSVDISFSSASRSTLFGMVIA